MSGFSLLSSIVAKLKDQLAKRRHNSVQEKHKMQENEQEQKLHKLRDGEKALLRELINSPGRTIYRPLSDGITSSLVARGIIVRISNAFHFDRTEPELTLPYTI